MPLDAVDVEWCPDEEAITWGVVISSSRDKRETALRQSGKIEGDFEGGDGGDGLGWKREGGEACQGTNSGV